MSPMRRYRLPFIFDTGQSDPALYECLILAWWRHHTRSTPCAG